MLEGSAIYSRTATMILACWKALVCTWLCLTCVAGHAAEPSAIQFKNLPSTAGLTFEHKDGSSGQHYLIEAVASGMATFDFDGDGDLDIYFLNGAALRGTVYASPPKNALFRNDGNFQFTDVTESSGLGDQGFGLGVAAGDYDNDGWIDVYLNNYGANALYRNSGDGTFSLVPDEVLACGHKVGAGASMLDMDADGDLDIYSANYIQFAYDLRSPSIFHGQIVYGGPVLYPTEPDDLLRNNGDGTFTNVSQEAGILSESEWGMSTICFDADADGDTDIFVANDSTRNFLWQNDGQGRFTEIGVLAGVAYDYQGDTQGSMGCDVADFNGDMLLDLFVTAYEKQLAILYENLGNSIFQDATLTTGAGAGSFHLVNWGLGFGDFDNDGDKDLFVANGHIHDNLDDFDDTTSYKMANQVYENKNGKRFVDISAHCGSGLQVIESSRGAVLEDLDEDGRLDVVVINSRTKPTLLQNISNSSSNWIEVELVGQVCNRSAIGCEVTVRCGARSQILTVHSGRGYQSHFGTRLHFGLGAAESIDELSVRWLGGQIESFTDVKASGLLIIRQGLGITKP